MKTIYPLEDGQRLQSRGLCHCPPLAISSAGRVIRKVSTACLGWERPDPPRGGVGKPQGLSPASSLKSPSHQCSACAKDRSWASQAQVFWGIPSLSTVDMATSQAQSGTAGEGAQSQALPTQGRGKEAAIRPLWP